MHKRIVSLDAFRGLAVVLMMLVNHVTDPALTFLQHADWNGWTLADTVFPFFLWITGVTMAFSVKPRRIFQRVIILFLLGLLINFSPSFQLATIRIPGVLQRIAICYLIAGLTYFYFGIKGISVLLVGLLAGYWILIKALGFDFPQAVDVFLLKGHLWSANFDPEGIISTIAATTTVLFGIFEGIVIKNFKPKLKEFIFLFSAGVGLIALGQIMNMWLPINKNLWTSSYSVFMTGLAFFLFAFFYFLIEIKGWKKVFFVLTVFGLNPLFIYSVSDILTDYVHLPAYAHLILFYLLAYIMYKKQWFITV